MFKIIICACKILLMFKIITCTYKNEKRNLLFIIKNRLMIQSNCANCNNKKFRFIKEQQTMGILSNLGIKTPLSKVPLLNILF